MDARIIYLLVFVALVLTIVFLERKYNFLQDRTTVEPKPYSFSRVQLVWWTFLVLTTFIATIIASGEVPTLTETTLVLLGIGSLTTVSANIVDLSDEKRQAEANSKGEPGGEPPLSKDLPREGFLVDILSDKTGVSIHRFQAFAFNLVLGLWFIYKSVMNIKDVTDKSTQDVINAVIPVITTNNLILLGLSAGTYLALKTSENK